MAFDRRRYGTREVKKRVEICVRNEFENCFENFFAATHPGQPVMNDGDAQVRKLAQRLPFVAGVSVGVEASGYSPSAAQFAQR